MCGRFTLRTPPAEWAGLFGLDEAPELPPRYNIAPSQEVAAVRLAAEGGRDPGADGPPPTVVSDRRELALLRWGLVPWWARSPDFDARTINARSETADRLPTFRDAFRERRCLIPADGFFEWRAEGGRKQPYHVRLRNGGVFALAGLWDRWEGPEGEALESCTVLTTDANRTLRDLHDRMPVVLTPQQGSAWLDPESAPRELRGLLRPAPEALLLFHPVTPRVNRPEFDEPGCVEPLAGPAGGAPAVQGRLEL